MQALDTEEPTAAATSAAVEPQAISAVETAAERTTEQPTEESQTSTQRVDEDTTTDAYVESLALVTDVIAIPRFDRVCRLQWTALERRVFDGVHSSHALTTSPHSAHKSRTAFAAAGQIWSLGQKEVKRRLATGGDGCLASREELLVLAKLPEINTDGLTSNYNKNWMHIVDVATRVILLETLEPQKAIGLSIASPARTPGRSGMKVAVSQISPPPLRSARRKTPAVVRSAVSFDTMALTDSSSENSPRSSLGKDRPAEVAASTDSEGDSPNETRSRTLTCKTMQLTTTGHLPVTRSVPAEVTKAASVMPLLRRVPVLPLP